MPLINTVVEQLAGWLSAQAITPPLREVTTVDLLPATAYPQVAVLADEESFGPGCGDVTAALRLRVAHAAGRPESAQATVRSLAHQVRAALAGSHRLGGRVKLLQVGAISYGDRDRPVEGGVIATAELEVTAKYCQVDLAG